MTRPAVSRSHRTFSSSTRDGRRPVTCLDSLLLSFKTGSWLIIGFALILAAGLPARGDVVKLVGGGELEGEVSERGDRLVVVIREGMEVMLDPEDVLEVVRRPNPRQLIEQRRRLLRPYDVSGLYELSLEALERGLRSEGLGLLERVLEINSNHEEARVLLGYVRVGESWMFRDEAQALAGKVRYRGQWMDVVERDARQSRARERDLQRQCRSLLRRYRRVGSEVTDQLIRKEVADLAPDPLAADLLSTLLASESHWRSRLLAADALRLWTTEGSARALAESALNDESPAVCIASVDSLRHRRNLAAGSRFLAVFLQTRNAERRQRAARALARLRAKSSVEPLISALYARSTKLRTVPVRTQQRGDSDRYSFGLVGQESRQVTDFHFDSLARYTLLAVTGRNFDYAKSDWVAWWEETRGSLDDFMGEQPVDEEAASPQDH